MLAVVAQQNEGLWYLGSWEYPVSLLVEHTGLISPCCCGFWGFEENGFILEEENTIAFVLLYVVRIHTPSAPSYGCVG